MAHRKSHLVKAQCHSVAIIRPPLQLTGRAQHKKITHTNATTTCTTNNMSVFGFQNDLKNRSSVLSEICRVVVVTMMKSTFCDVMSEHTVRETAAFHSELSITEVMESYVNLWLNHDWLVNVCGIYVLLTVHLNMCV
jgi:hypothetical protein